MLSINKNQLDRILTELEQTDLSNFYKTNKRNLYTIKLSRYVLSFLFIIAIALITLTWALIIAIPLLIECLYKEYINDKRSST